MHSGPVKELFISKIFNGIALLAIIVTFQSCKEDSQQSLSFRFPDQGQTFPLGEQVKVELNIPAGEKINQATYLVDGKEVARRLDGSAVTISTDGFSVGYKLITALVERDNVKDTLTINIVMKSGKKPEMLGYKVVNVFPHDTSAYTQGLEFHNGRFLESTGLTGYSTLKWVSLQTGRAIQKVDLEKQYFGEGATLVADKIVMLTWKSNLGLIFDAKSLVQQGTFPYQNSREGWGLCFDGKRLIKSDGTNRIYFLNKDTYREESAIDVFDHNGPVDSINELEFIDGKIFANIYTKDYIVVIDPNSGIVERQIDLTGLLAKGYDKMPRDSNIDVLNGIAWDKVNNRLFVTGKKWPKLFEITLDQQ